MPFPMGPLLKILICWSGCLDSLCSFTFHEVPSSSRIYQDRKNMDWFWEPYLHVKLKWFKKIHRLTERGLEVFGALSALAEALEPLRREGELDIWCRVPTIEAEPLSVPLFMFRASQLRRCMRCPMVLGLPWQVGDAWGFAVTLDFWTDCQVEWIYQWGSSRRLDHFDRLICWGLWGRDLGKMLLWEPPHSSCFLLQACKIQVCTWQLIFSLFNWVTMHHPPPFSGLWSNTWWNSSAKCL